MTGQRIKRRGAGRFLLLAALGLTAVACGDEVTAPGALALRVSTSGAALIGDPDPAMVSTLLDSFSIGGVYAVLPMGGYGGGTTYSTRLGSAETILRHPTGIVLPAGLPVRLLAEGVVVSTATPSFRSTWCPGTPDQSTLCDAESISYSV